MSFLERSQILIRPFSQQLLCRRIPICRCTLNRRQRGRGNYVNTNEAPTRCVWQQENGIVSPRQLFKRNLPLRCLLLSSETHYFRWCSISIVSWRCSRCFVFVSGDSHLTCIDWILAFPEPISHQFGYHLIE